MLSRLFSEPDEQLSINFGYQCVSKDVVSCEVSEGVSLKDSGNGRYKKNNSFSCLSGAALSANFTLANTTICNGLIGEGILAALDSPNKFQSVPSSSSLLSLDVLSSSLQGTRTNITGSASSQSDRSEFDMNLFKALSAPSRSEGFLNAAEVKMAGGAAGEDRVQAVCSEENGWLFCGIYDGFNGRDAADFLAGTLYDNIRFYLNALDSEVNQNYTISLDQSCPDLPFQYDLEDSSLLENYFLEYNRSNGSETWPTKGTKILMDSSRQKVLDSLKQALAQAEHDFLCMVGLEMDERPDLVSVGSCVLVVLLYGQNLYTLNLGDSRAVLATQSGNYIDETGELDAFQLTDWHSVDNEKERVQLLLKHPDDPKTIVAGRVKGKLKLTRAFGVGYLKKKELNDALMGILQVQNLLCPPYISTEPSLHVHRISEGDRFVILASDGMFDFFSNQEAVELVDSFIMRDPFGSPAKFLVEQLVAKAAQRAGIILCLTVEELLRVPAGRRRKYHDDVTVIVILLGSDQRTSRASTLLEK
ncbi:hypothetical protein Taro_003775 [Colocasia esculenta]|uniref:protein-serine/threonine phosphatase n=1 Tax=Colocasia esculenta TaxID=4460 RepID=A0A843TKS6_COLES|nr:hypothetical protein [Colocasia esculenta]